MGDVFEVADKHEKTSVMVMEREGGKERKKESTDPAIADPTPVDVVISHHCNPWPLPKPLHREPSTDIVGGGGVRVWSCFVEKTNIILSLSPSLSQSLSLLESSTDELAALMVLPHR